MAVLLGLSVLFSNTAFAQNNALQKNYSEKVKQVKEIRINDNTQETVKVVKTQKENIPQTLKVSEKQPLYALDKEGNVIKEHKSEVRVEKLKAIFLEKIEPQDKDNITDEK